MVFSTETEYMIFFTLPDRWIELITARQLDLFKEHFYQHHLSASSNEPEYMIFMPPVN